MRALAAALVLALAATTAAQTRDGAAGATLVRRETTVVRDFPAGYGHGLQLSTGPRGSVRVTAWRERSIRVEARLEILAPTEAELDTLGAVVGTYFEPGPTLVEVSTKGTHDKKWMKGAKGFPKALLTMPWRVDYVVHVPEYAALTLLVGEGETVVEGVNGIVSVASARGPVRLTRVSGPTKVEAAGGDVEISTSERSWRGGNLTATAAGALRLRAPLGFSCELDAASPGGVTVGGQALGSDFRGRLGGGGAGVTLLGGSRVEILLE